MITYAILGGVAVADFLVLIKRNNILIKELTFMAIYLIGLTFVVDMDIILPIYFIFSFIPFLPSMKHLSKFSILLLMYFLVYLIFGIISQETASAISAFISKYWQFCIALLVINKRNYPALNIKRKHLWLLVIIESVLGVYLLLTSSMVDDENGMTRLVSGHQPITGNIAIIGIMLSAMLYSDTVGQHAKKSILMADIVLYIWVILSGTRGYLLIYTIVFAYIVYHFLADKSASGDVKKTRYILIILLIIVMFLTVIILPSVLERVSSLLRISGSTGIRKYENAAELEFWKNASARIKILGIGLGGTPGKFRAYVNAISRQRRLGMWHITHYLSDSGALFHNFYADALLNLGVVGLVIILIINIIIWSKTNRMCIDNRFMRIGMHLFHIGLLLMIYFRWSATCGIAELIVYGLILQKVRQESSVKEQMS